MGRILDWGTNVLGAARRRMGAFLDAARDPRRVLPALAVLALLLIGIPLTMSGLARVSRVALDWRQESATAWRETSGRVVQVRDQAGLVVRVVFEARGDRQEANVYVGDTGRRWIDARPRIRYDVDHPDRAEIIGFGAADPIPGLLLAGAPLGAGLGALWLAFGLWRRRRLVVVSARPVAALRPVLVGASIIVLAGIAAWAVGTILQRGWSAVASGAANLAATVFGDLLGVLVPLVAFALGALVATWLARHRGAEEQTGLLSRAHRLIGRAADRMPSPEELRAERPASGPNVPAPPVSGPVVPDPPA
jgi:hypothetical protein